MLSQIVSIALSIGTIDPLLVAAIAKVESNLNPAAIGRIGEIGLMQLRPEYVSSSVQLFNPEQNIKEGIKKLEIAKRSCKHRDDFTFVVCYNAGIKGGSRLQYPKRFAYYKKVMSEYLKLQLEVGQKVTIKRLHYNQTDGDAIVEGPGDQNNPLHKGKWIVYADGVSLPIEEERIVV